MGSVGEVLTTQLGERKFDFQNPQKAKFRALVIPTLGRWRWAYPWDSLSTQPSLLIEFQANMTLSHKAKWVVP